MTESTTSTAQSEVGSASTAHSEVASTLLSSQFEEDESPASFSILIRTSSESTVEVPRERISILIRDDEGGATDKQALRYSHTHPTPFQRGHTDLFVMTNQPSLGHLSFCEIHYNGKNEVLGGPWKCHTCVIFHHENGRVYNFQVDKKQSTDTVSVMTCKDDGIQIMSEQIRDPFE